MSKTTIPTGGITADAIDATLIADDAISEEHLDPTAITASTEKSTLVAADKFLIADSADSNAIKYVQQSNLGSGSLVKLAQANSTTDTTNINIDSVFSNVYSAYRFVCSFKTVNEDIYIAFRWRASSSDLTVSQYYGAARGGHINGSAENVASYASWGTNYLKVGHALHNNNYNGYHLDALLYPYNNGGVANISSIDNASNIIYHASYWGQTAERHEQVSGAGTYTQTTVPDGFGFHLQSGDFDGYNYALFGYKG